MPASDALLTSRDVIRLYGAFNRQLTQVVRNATRGSRAVVEDACQVAWTGMIGSHQQVQAENARAWLIRTAVREGFRLMRLEARESSLELALEEQAPGLEWVTSTEPNELLSRREQMRNVRLLSVRQQRLVWLRALGFSYEEMATYEGVSNRTIRRQMERARKQLQTLYEAGETYRAAA